MLQKKKKKLKKIYAKTRKKLESYIAPWKPDLNDEKNFERLVLFRTGVT